MNDVRDGSHASSSKGSGSDRLCRQHPKVAGTLPPTGPERVLQVGEGNFLRGFADWMLNRLVRSGRWTGSVVMTPARPPGGPRLEALTRQDGLYTVWTRGLERSAAVDRTEVVSVIGRVLDPFRDWLGYLALAESSSLAIVISNTTERGIFYDPAVDRTRPETLNYPARLTELLHRRFRFADADPAAGLVMMPCELVENNGALLRSMVLQYANAWGLGSAFGHWVEEHNSFVDTLVDRIVPGRPPEAADTVANWGYADDFAVVAEPYRLWAISDDERTMARLPFDRLATEDDDEGDQDVGLGAFFTSRVDWYRERKLRVLNGTHTFLAPLGLLLEMGTVREVVTHERWGGVVRGFLHEVVLPAVGGPAGLGQYADQVWDRFRNPFVDHRLSDITLNALGKFRIRLAPLWRRLPREATRARQALAWSLASQIWLYSEGNPGKVKDAPEIIERVHGHLTSEARGEGLAALLADPELWGEEGLEPDLVGAVQAHWEAIRRGNPDAIARLLG